MNAVTAPRTPSSSSFAISKAKRSDVRPNRSTQIATSSRSSRKAGASKTKSSAFLGSQKPSSSNTLPYGRPAARKSSVSAISKKRT